MVYTPEEKQKMEHLLELFGEFLANNQDVDIAYSDKTGYVRLIIAEDADQIFFPMAGYDELLTMFFCDVLYDEVHRAMWGEPPPPEGE